MIKKAKRFDWEGVKAKVAAARAALERTQEADPRRMEQILAQRARQLAKPRETQDQNAATVPVLVCVVGPERYALALTALSEILPLTRCTAVPGGPPELSGVINVRGEIRSVVDLARLLDLPEVPDRPAGFAVLLRGKVEFGLRVDQVERIEQVPPEALIAGVDAGLSLPALTLSGPGGGQLIPLNAAEIVARIVGEKA